MAIEFKVPELGEDIDSAEIAGISISEGDVIEADQTVFELETDKAVFDLPCPHAGKVTKIHVSEGDSIKVGQTVLTIDESGEGDGPAEEPQQESKADESDESPKEEASEEAPAKTQGKADKKEQKQEKKESKQEQKKEKKQPSKDEKADQKKQADEKKSQKPSEESASDKDKPKPEEKPAEEGEPPLADELESGEVPAAGPATRRLARKLGVDLRQVKGSGPGGRITQEDVVSAHDQTFHIGAPAGMTLPSAADFEKFGEVRTERLNKIAQTSASSLHLSWSQIPHVTQHELVDITEVDAARSAYGKLHRDDGPKLTLTAIAVKALANILPEFPRFNASFGRDELIIKEYYHIGVAVDTDQGLLVPVIRDADQKSLLEIAAELQELAAKARDRKLKVEQMRGASFTVTNLGGIGGNFFTPIVNYPEVAILGMSRGRTEMRAASGALEQRLMLPLSLSYDHRAINGADAARFIVRLSTVLSNPFELLLGSQS